MPNSSQHSTGTSYTSTAAYLAVAFVFSPATLLLSRPVGYVSVSLAIVCSAICLALAWLNWKKSSERSIPSIDAREATGK
jgi:hypothetical protein